MKNKNITERGYYLGEDKYGLKVYLQKPSWDCGWYWGFGYLEGYRNYAHDCDISIHWDSIVKDSNENAFDAMKHYFKELTISDDSLWLLCDYMKSFYTLKEMAELCHIGNSHYTETSNISFKDEELYNKINKELLPKLFKEIEKLFLEEDK